MIIHKEMEQGQEAWDLWRAPLATASEFGKIFTGGGKVSAQREPYMRKCAISRKYKLPSWGGNAATERGHLLEPVARDLFVNLTGLDVREVAGIEHDNGLCGGSPDGLIYSADGRLIGGLEIKAFNYDKHVGIIAKGAMPTDNKPQVHGSLWLTSLPCWQFMVFHDDAEPFTHAEFEIEPDQYTADLGGEVLKFCEELDRRAEEFISDYEESMTGAGMKEAMPILFRQNDQVEESII